MFQPTLQPELVERCRTYAGTLSMSDESQEELPNHKGSVHRIRFHRGEQHAIRTEIRSMLTTRVLVDLSPMGAVLILLETARQRSMPRRLVSLPGDHAGEYTEGAIEAAWGAVMLEGSASGNAFLGMRFPGEPRRLSIQDVIGLAESAL